MTGLVSVDWAGPGEDPSHVAIVTMTHAEKRNSLSAAMLAELEDALEQAEGAGSRALILRAEPGASTWSAGYSIDALPRDGADPLTWTNPLEGFLRRLRQVPFPVIAAVEGGVWGGACELILTCDLVIAVRTATFALTPARLGVPYNTAGVARVLSALPLNAAKELFFTADPQSAAAWETYGVVNRLVEDADELHRSALTLATRIAQLAPLSIQAVKAEMAALTDTRSLTRDDVERLTELRRTAWTSRDYREGVQAFLEKRTARFEGR